MRVPNPLDGSLDVGLTLYIYILGWVSTSYASLTRARVRDESIGPNLGPRGPDIRVWGPVYDPIMGPILGVP